MIPFKIADIFIKFQRYIGIPLDIVFVSLSIIWTVYFINKIVICIKMQKKCLNERNSDSDYARKNKCEMVKYVFLLLINITECGYMPLYGLGGLLPPELLYSSSRPMLPNCANELISSKIFDINLILENPFKAFLMVLVQVVMLFYLTFLTCLMHYLHIIFHSIPLNPFRFIRRFLLLTSLLSFFLIIVGTVPQLILS